MADPTPEHQLAEISRRLDEGVGEDDAGHSVVDRVQDVIDGFNQWTNLAIKRLHQIHRLQGEECGSCAVYLDESA